MKSKRAEEYLKDNREEIEINWETGETEQMIWPKDARRAVELAEEEMAEKAANVFAQRCDMYDDDGTCLIGKTCKDCKIVTRFKQELME